MWHDNGWTSCNIGTSWLSLDIEDSERKRAIVSVPCAQHPGGRFAQENKGGVGCRWGLKGGDAEMGLHASSGKSLPGFLLRIINRLSMSGSR